MSEPLLPCAWLFIISFWIERWVGWLLTLHLSNYQIVCWLRTLHSIGVISSHLILHLSIVRLKISHLTSLIYVSPLSTSRSTSHFVVTILIGSLRQAPISSTLPTQDGNLSDCGQHNLQFLSNKMEMLAIFHRFEIEDLCFKRDEVFSHRRAPTNHLHPHRHCHLLTCQVLILLLCYYITTFDCWKMI